MEFSKSVLIRVVCCIPFYLGAVYADDGKLAQRPDVRQFIVEMVKKHQFNENELTSLFNQINLQDKIIDIISKPAESKPWYEYRPIFITKKRIRGGVEFWNENREILSRAYETYGVPPQIITAILGVETFYGRQKGGYRILDSLATLSFDYPPRSKFFMSELEQYLLMTREENIDPLSITGSYAGAMGKAQFISSSYRRYAVDFDNDGKRDLWNNNADAIGSVAHYLNIHGWKKGQPIASRAMVGDHIGDNLLSNGLKPNSTVHELKESGVHIEDDAIADNLRTILISLETRSEPEYWVGYNNFYVITRYNHSALYAMAVYQLSEEIAAKGIPAVAVSEK